MEEMQEDINHPKYDPFRRYDVPLTNKTEKIKTYVFAVFVLPIRLFFMITWFILYAFVLSVGMIGVDPSKPLPSYSKFCKETWMLLFPYSKFKLIDIMLFAFGFPSVTIYGTTSMEDKETGTKANIIVTNHISYLDILALMSYHETIPSFVSKKEVLGVPLFGWKSRIWQCLYVDRFAPAGGGVASQIDLRAKSLDFPPILIFPEGTTSNGQFIMPFKTGAFLGGNPVKPVALKYPYKNFSPAWESMSIFSHMFRLLTQVYNRIEIHFMPVYVPTPEERADPVLYASNVRAEIAKVLGVGLTESSVKEKFEYLKLLKEQQAKQKSA